YSVLEWDVQIAFDYVKKQGLFTLVSLVTLTTTTTPKHDIMRCNATTKPCITSNCLANKANYQKPQPQPENLIKIDTLPICALMHTLIHIHTPTQAK
ncbi:unnamed protein product, partial [Ceratitis capitata]